MAFLNGLCAALYVQSRNLGRRCGRDGQKRIRGQRRRRLLFEALEPRVLLSASGGFTNAGLEGQYFNNTTLSGTPSFVRSDVRIDFNWGSGATTQAPGGSTDPGFNAVGANNWSAEWTGSVIPAFSETYTFTATADDGVIVNIKPTGTNTWTTLVNNWTNSNITTYNANYTMTAGTSYDIQLEHYQATDQSELVLQWSSPSMPQQVIGPVTETGISFSTAVTGSSGKLTQAYTNLVEGSPFNSWSGINGGAAPAMDANGWPEGDGRFYFVTGMDPMTEGTVTLSFNGQATLSVGGNVVNGSLTYTYNASTNTTTGTFTTENRGYNSAWLDVTNSTRTGVAGGPGGITNLKLMRPTSPGATTSYASDTTFTPQILAAVSNFTAIRFQLVANQQQNWSDRTSPNYFNQNGGVVTSPNTNPSLGVVAVGGESNNGPSWEMKIMLANETGRDLMLSLPPLANDQYITNLANLLKYGSDANGNPYTAPTANPVHPGLNSNLHVYFEIGNELWNFSYPYGIDFGNINALTAQHVQANDADFQIINYDNLSTATNSSGQYVSMGTWRYRMIVLRMIQISNIFRSVYGNAAMPDSGNPDAVIRPLYEWQYANNANTANLGLTWAQNYFDNADGTQHVSNPEPINYYLWGGGGATYYGADNTDGLTNLPADNNFSTSTTLPAGYNQDPTGTPFTFTGTAGIAGYTSGNTLGIPQPISQLYFPGQGTIANSSNQLGYITDTGQISFTFTTPTSQTSNLYAFDFKAVNRTESNGTVDQENLRVYLDYGTANQQDITAVAVSQPNGYTPVSYAQSNFAGTYWDGRMVSWALSDYYFTQALALTAGSTHTITIVGQGDIANPSLTDQTAFFTDLRVTSVDAIYAGGMPAGGDANSQPVGENLINTLNVEADWAKAFGLQEVSYEGGWSLGGDDGGSYIQNDAKFGDSRTATVQETYRQYFDQAGSELSILGTYSQWPVYGSSYSQEGLLNINQYPIVQAVNASANQLPAAATNGLYAPTVLTAPNAVIYNSSSNSGQITSAGGFIDWMVIIPDSGYYTLNLTTTGTGGTAALVADGVQIAGGATGGTPITASVYFTAGNHGIAVWSAGSTAITVSQVSIAGQNAPVSPALNSVTSSAASPGNDGQANLSWTSVSGAIGYVVRYGTQPEPDSFSVRLDVGNATSYTVTGLTTEQEYYFVVDSYNASGESLPSNTAGTDPLAPSQVGELAAWNFYSQMNGAGSTFDGNITADSSTLSSLTASELTRGSGLPAAALFYDNGYGAVNSHGKSASSLSAAQTSGAYLQFTVTPTGGDVLSLNALDFIAYQQNYSLNPNATITVEYSLDGFSTETTAGSVTDISYSTGTQNTWQGTAYSVDLSGQSSLQNISANTTVTFRLYFWNFGAGDQGLGQWMGANAADTNDLALTGNSTLITGSTPLVQDTFSGTSIANPPWITTTANGGTISENGALDVGLAPALNETAYVSASDGASSLKSTATSVTYDLQANINFSNLTLTDNTRAEETIDVLRLFPASGNNALASAFLMYDTYNNTVNFEVQGGVQYGGGSGAFAGKIAPASFSSITNQQWNLSTTFTNNGNNSWTYSNTLTVAYGSNQSTVVTTTYTATANNSNFNPITDNNLVSVGDILHSGLSGTPNMSGSYNITNFSDTLISTKLPAGWTDQAIGSPSPTGSASSTAGVYTVTGGGSGIGGTSDSFNFASESVTGSQTINAQVASQTDTASGAQAGVMLRDSSAADAMFAAVEETPGDGIVFQWRSSTGGSVQSVSGGTSGTPEWLELVSSGNTYSAYYSSDGSTWTQLGSTQTINFSNNTYLAGLAVSSDVSGVAGTATFTNVDPSPTVNLTTQIKGHKASQTSALTASATSLSSTAVGTTSTGSTAPAGLITATPMTGTNPGSFWQQFTGLPMLAKGWQSPLSGNFSPDSYLMEMTYWIMAL